MGQQNNKDNGGYSNSGASSTTQISDDSRIVSAVELLKDRYPGQLNQIKNEALLFKDSQNCKYHIVVENI